MTNSTQSNYVQLRCLGNYNIGIISIIIKNVKLFIHWDVRSSLTENNMKKESFQRTNTHYMLTQNPQIPAKSVAASCRVANFYLHTCKLTGNVILNNCPITGIYG